MTRRAFSMTASAAMLAGIAFSNLAHADQCATMPTAQAYAALRQIPYGSTILPLCEPCGEQVDLSRVTTVRSSMVMLNDLVTGHVTVNGDSVDVAYLYVRGADGVFRNVAMLAGCPVEHVSATVTPPPPAAPTVIVAQPVAPPPPPPLPPHAILPPSTTPPPPGAIAAPAVVTSCNVRNTGMLGMGAGREAIVGVLNRTTSARAFTVRIYATYPGNGRESVAVSAVPTVPGVLASARVRFAARPGMVSILCEVEN